MRHTILSILFLLGPGLAVGGTSTEGKSQVGPNHNGTEAAQRDKAKTETKEAAQAMQDYTYAQKADLVDKMNGELLEIKQELNRLSAKIDKSGSAANADAKTKLEAVRQKWAQAKKQLDQSKNATESTWDDVKGGFKKSYGDLKESFDKTRQKLSEQIAP